jgi:hypothetical protein
VPRSASSVSFASVSMYSPQRLVPPPPPPQQQQQQPQAPVIVNNVLKISVSSMLLYVDPAWVTALHSCLHGCLGALGEMQRLSLRPPASGAHAEQQQQQARGNASASPSPANLSLNSSSFGSSSNTSSSSSSSSSSSGSSSSSSSGGGIGHEADFHVFTFDLRVDNPMLVVPLMHAGWLAAAATPAAGTDCGPEEHLVVDLGKIALWNELVMSANPLVVHADTGAGAGAGDAAFAASAGGDSSLLHTCVPLTAIRSKAQAMNVVKVRSSGARRGVMQFVSYADAAAHGTHEAHEDNEAAHNANPPHASAVPGPGPGASPAPPSFSEPHTEMEEKKLFEDVDLMFSAISPLLAVRAEGLLLHDVTCSVDKIHVRLSDRDVTFLLSLANHSLMPLASLAAVESSGGAAAAGASGGGGLLDSSPNGIGSLEQFALAPSPASSSAPQSCVRVRLQNCVLDLVRATGVGGGDVGGAEPLHRGQKQSSWARPGGGVASGRSVSGAGGSAYRTQEEGLLKFAMRGASADIEMRPTAYCMSVTFNTVQIFNATPSVPDYARFT